jgi:hypothetical protein
MLESSVENYLAREVQKAGGEVRKVSWPGRRGAPDRLVLIPERWVTNAKGQPHHEHPIAVYVELKRPGETPEPHQVREHRRLRSYGQRVFVIDNKGQVDNFIKEMFG